MTLTTGDLERSAQQILVLHQINAETVEALNESNTQRRLAIETTLQLKHKTTTLEEECEAAHNQLKKVYKS